MSNYNQGIISTGDLCFDVIGAIFRLAVEDARRGDPNALQWLAVVAPDWIEQGEKWHKRTGGALWLWPSHLIVRFRE